MCIGQVGVGGLVPELVDGGRITGRLKRDDLGRKF